MGMMGSKGGKGLVSDINVTPLVDVMLVLLIIFMITAPMMAQSGDINLPETSAQELHQEGDPLAISMGKGPLVKLGETEMTEELLVQELDKIPNEKKEKQIIYLHADKDVPYGRIYFLLEKLREKGFKSVGMVTKPTDNATVKRK